MNAESFHRRFDLLLEGIQIISYDWRYVYLNHSMEKMARRPKEELLGKTLMEAFPDIDQTDGFKLLQDSMENRVTHRFNNFFEFPDGEKKWFELLVTPDEAGICVLCLDVTDYRESEQKAVRAKKKFRAMVEKGVDLKSLADKHGNFLYVSPSICHTLEYTEAELLTINLNDIIHPDDLEKFQENWNHLIQNPEMTIHYQFRVYSRSGKEISGEGNSTNLLNEPGINAVVSNFLDITERKRFEQQLEFEKNNLDALINNTYDLMWSIDRNFCLITSNKPFDEVTASRRGKPLKQGEYIMDGVNETQKQWFNQQYRRAFEGERVSKTIYTSSLSKLWLEVSFLPIWVKDEVIGVACHAHDITRTKTLEDNLNKTIRQLSDYRYALDASSIVAITDSNGVIMNVNDNFSRISGYAREELTGRNHRILNSGHHPKEFFEDLWKTITKGLSWRGEIRNVSKTGEIYWVDTTIVPFLNEFNRPYQFISIQSDITSRKQAEEDLIQNIDRLNKTNFELDRFAYSVSHDLRSPITSIMGLVSFIEDETREDRTQIHVKMIKSEILRLDEYIKKILSYSKNNRIPIQVEPVSIQEKAQEIAEAVSIEKKAEDVRIDINIEENAPFYTDPNSLSVVLQNLISNAVKFHKSHESDKYVRISGHSDQEELFLTIEDNGIGISEEHQSRIFDMFFKLSGNDADGSGIGLYITREIISKLQGEILVESKQGKGSCFKVKIKNLKP